MLLSLPVSLNREEQNTLLKSPNRKTAVGVRDTLLMNFILNYGLRLYELIHLEWEDLNLDGKSLIIIESNGTARRELVLRLADVKLLQDWYRYQSRKRGRSVFVFTTLSGRKMPGAYVESILKRHARRAGILKRISPHTLRHIFAVDAYKKTGDIEKVSKLLGHKYLSTTEEYLTIMDARVSPSQLRWLRD